MSKPTVERVTEVKPNEFRLKLRQNGEVRETDMVTSATPLSSDDLPGFLIIETGIGWVALRWRG